MKKETNLTLGISEPQKVDAYLQNFDHPMLDVINYLRKIILSADVAIGEGIYWNAPTFFYTDAIKPFVAKDYKRYLVGFVFNKKDVIRMVFLRGATVNDKSNILSGEFKDERKLAVFTSMDDVKNKEKAFIEIIKQLINLMK